MSPTNDPQTWENPQIEALGDDLSSDTESLSSFNTDTTSLSSTVFNYTYENGRRYHSYRAGKYMLPNDETEQDRLDLMHHVWLLLTNGKLVLAPLKEEFKSGKFKALDLGTGTGIFAIELADEFPSATVIGTDLSPIQPSWVPSNCSFQVDDFDEDWTWPTNHFDFIHTRTLTGAVKDWESLIEKSFKHLAPGGFIELKEFDLRMLSDDGTVKDDSPSKQYFDTLIKASATAGRRLDTTSHLPSYLEKTGFVDIVNKDYKVPCGLWPKDKRFREIGMWTMESSKTGLEAYGLALFTRVLGMEQEEAKKLCKGCIEDMQNRKVHGYGWWKVVYARKPGKKD